VCNFEQTAKLHCCTLLFQNEQECRRTRRTVTVRLFTWLLAQQPWNHPHRSGGCAGSFPRTRRFFAAPSSPKFNKRLTALSFAGLASRRDETRTVLQLCQNVSLPGIQTLVGSLCTPESGLRRTLRYRYGEREAEERWQTSHIPTLHVELSYASIASHLPLRIGGAISQQTRFDCALRRAKPLEPEQGVRDGSECNAGCYQPRWGKIRCPTRSIFNQFA
jgi:hypothetical protein